MIVLLVMTDGRDDLLEHTLGAASVHMAGAERITRRIMWDDTGDACHRFELAIKYPDFTIVGNDRRNGFGGAIRSAWTYLQTETEEPYIFHLEDDFTFERPVHLAAVAETLGNRPHLAQLAFRRQPWNDIEIAAGGVIETDPDAFTERWMNGMMGQATARWLEHRKFWTTNPSMFRREILNIGWPDDPRSEGKFTARILEGFGKVPADDVRFGYWGHRGSGVWVQHRGTVRAGTGY